MFLLTSNVYQDLKSKGNVVRVFIYLFKALDSLSHQILINKLIQQATHSSKTDLGKSSNMPPTILEGYILQPVTNAKSTEVYTDENVNRNRHIIVWIRNYSAGKKKLPGGDPKIDTITVLYSRRV